MKGIHTSSVGNITWRKCSLELYRPERKGRYVKDDTAINRPDKRTPRATDDTRRKRNMKKFEKSVDI